MATANIGPFMACERQWVDIGATGSGIYIRQVQKITNQFAWTSEPFQAKKTKNQLPIWQNHHVPVGLPATVGLLQRISYLWFLKLVVRRNHPFIQTYLCIYSRCVYFGVKLVHISCTIPLCIWAIRTKSIYNNKSSLTSLKQTYSVCNLILPLSVLHQLCMIPRSIEHSSNCLGSRRGRNIHATETCRSLRRFVYQQPTLLPVQRPSIR